MKFNKKMVMMLCSVFAVILLIIVIMILFAGGKSKTLSFSEIESKIVNAGTRYYLDNESELPEHGTISVDVSTLISKGYLNDLSKYTNDDVSCNGKLYVTKNPNDYSYRAQLDCGDNYKTKTLKDIIVSEVVTTGSGLYLESQVNPNNPDELSDVYIFRGETVNNYVKIGDFYWKIVKVYENGEVAVLGDSKLLRAEWDNRFNLETDNYRGINEYEVSRMKDSILTEVVEDKEGYKLIKGLITTHTACIGKRMLNDSSTDGSIECSETLENQYFSLLPVYDYMNASLDENCTHTESESCYNYNYLSESGSGWWTVTGVADNNQDVYYVANSMKDTYANSTKAARLYAHLDANVSYVSGTGTYEDPYILK